MENEKTASSRTQRDAASAFRQTPVTKRKTCEQLASEYLLMLSFNPRLMGYRLLREAILLAAQKKGKPFLLKKDIYPALTEKYRLKAANLERNISNSIDNAFLSVDIDRMENLFGSTISAKSGKPTVKELIAAASVHILLNTDIFS